MENVPDFLDDVDDELGLYLLFDLHVELVQDDDGTQRSEEPAKRGPTHEGQKNKNILSKSMRNFCAGVPMEIVPAHSSSSSSSVKGSL